MDFQPGTVVEIKKSEISKHTGKAVILYKRQPTYDDNAYYVRFINSNIKQNIYGHEIQIAFPDYKMITEILK